MRKENEDDKRKYEEDVWRHFFFGSLCIGAAALLTIVTLVKMF